MSKIKRWTQLLPLVAAAVLALIVALPNAKVSAAAPALSLTTSPVSLDLSIQPGDSQTKTLEIMNNGSQPVPITMQVDVFGAYGNTGQAAINAPKSGDSTPSYVHFSTNSFIAQPKVWSQVQMTIKLPDTASLGYYFAIIFKPTLPASTATANAATIKGSNAVLVLIDTHSSNESRQVSIGNFSVSKKLYQYLPVSFNVSMHNAGNIFLAPSGDIFISRNSNLTHSLATLSVNSGGGNVLPDSDRNFTESWTDGFPVYQDKLVNGQPVTNKSAGDVQQLKWNAGNLNKFRFGKYYAGLTLIYNNGSRTVPLSAVVSFWVIPWKLMLLALIPVLIILFGLWSIVRSVVRRLKRIRQKKS